MKATVVIPVYNQFLSLLMVLEGFSQQTYSKDLFDVVIVDDGSTDALSGLQDFSWLRCKHKIIHNRRRGAAAARL